MSDRFTWSPEDVQWDDEKPARDCPHPVEQWKFNGGNPWVICHECGVKLRDATPEDTERAYGKR